MVVLKFIDEEYYELDGKKYEIKDNRINGKFLNITDVVGKIPNNLKNLHLSDNQLERLYLYKNQLTRSN